MEYMEIDRDFPRLADCAVTLGKFDGVHLGHRKLIKKILERKEEGEKAVLFAFRSSKNSIFTSSERRAMLEEMGVDVLLECPLNDRIRQTPAEVFVREVLVGDLHASYVAVGEDFRFGYERKGTPGLLRELGRKYGFQTDVLPKEMDGHRKISSTYIREELKRGNMEKVSGLLGCDFFVTETVEHGRGLGHKVLFPTANLRPRECKLMPPNGVYVTVSRFEERMYQGITNVGYKPTVDGNFLGVETYLFDCDEDLYGRQCTVYFKKYIRPEHRFQSVEALKRQMEHDILSGRDFFGKNPVDK